MANIERARKAAEEKAQLKLDAAARAEVVSSSPASIAPKPVRMTVNERKPVSEPSPKRMAGTRIEEILGNADNLKSWKNTPRGRNDPNYHGRNLGEWREHNQKLSREMDGLANDGNFGKLEDRLIEEGYKFDELDSQIYDYEERGRRGIGALRQDFYDVSQAAADEQVSKLILDAAGLKNAQIWNSDPLMGTDLRADFEGAQVNIDAQQRLGAGRALNLGIFQNSPELVNFVADNRDVQLKTLIDGYLAGGLGPVRGFEDKLLQTMDDRYNPNPTKRLREGAQSFGKRLLITNRRSGQGIKDLHDKALPKSSGIIDLNKARELILGLSYNEVKRQYPGIQMRADAASKGNLKLSIPNEHLGMMLADIDMRPINTYLNRR
jgi:hypothetical protein